VELNVCQLGATRNSTVFREQSVNLQQVKDSTDTWNEFQILYREEVEALVRHANSRVNASYSRRMARMNSAVRMSTVEDLELNVSAIAWKLLEFALVHATKTLQNYPCCIRA